MWKELLRAARFARMAHAGQKRGHGAPYYKHPMAVAALLWKKGHRELEVLQAAYLHDVLEDTAHPFEELAKEFGEGVATMVAAVTKPEEWRAEPPAYYEQVMARGPLAVALKMADREHNDSELRYLPPEMEYKKAKAAAKRKTMEKVFFGAA